MICCFVTKCIVCLWYYVDVRVMHTRARQLNYRITVDSRQYEVRSSGHSEFPMGKIHRIGFRKELARAWAAVARA